MWSADTRRITASLLITLLCFGAVSAVAQQSSLGVPLQNGGQPGQAAVSAEKPSSDNSQPAPSTKRHFTTTLQPQVVNPGEMLPSRYNPDYEDWSSPELPRDMTMESEQLGKVDGGGFTREFWMVQWRELDPIELWVIRPPYLVVKPPVILYLYSSNANNARYKDDEFCRFVTRNGFAAVGLVSAVTGQRFHDRAQRETFVSQLPEALATTSHDLQMVLNFLEKRDDLDMNRVGIWADGSGASIAILAAAVDQRIKALDLLDPWGDWPEWLAKTTLVEEDKRAYYLSPNFQHLLENLDPLKWFPKLKTAKVRLQYIKEGVAVTPAITREKMVAAAPATTEIVYYDNAQRFMSEVAAKGSGFDWIKQNLSLSTLSGSEEQKKAKASLEPKGSQPQ